VLSLSSVVALLLCNCSLCGMLQVFTLLTICWLLSGSPIYLTKVLPIIPGGFFIRPHAPHRPHSMTKLDWHLTHVI